MSWLTELRTALGGALEGGAEAFLESRGRAATQQQPPQPADPSAEFDDARSGMPSAEMEKAGRGVRARAPQGPLSGLQPPIETPATGGKGKGGVGLAGIFTDPEMDMYGVRGVGGEYAERPTGMSWDTLRRMAKTPPIAAVGNTMCAGVAEFCTPRPNRHLPGMQVRKRGQAARYQPTKAEAKEMVRVADFLYHCGHYADRRELVNRPTLEQLVRASFWDSFRFDQMTVQVEPKAGWAPGGKFEPHRFYAWPAHTMRLAMPPADGSRLADDDFTTVRSVQVDKHNSVVGEFTGEQMMWGVLNPLTDVENAGYGYSVLEQLVDVLSGWLYGYGYNKAYFKQGANVKGILHFNEEPPLPQQRRFERYFHALVMGVGNAHKVPIAWGGKANWLSLGQTNRDMEFNQWMDFLTKVLCAICGMDPAEINFTYGNTGQANSIGGQASSAEKIEGSRNRWLRPRVRALFTWLNIWIVWAINPDLEVVPTGIDVRSEEAEHTRLMDLAQHTHTVDEVRAMQGDEPLTSRDPKEAPGAVILNTVWQQMQTAANAPEEAEGAPGETEEQPSPEDAKKTAASLFGLPNSEGGDKEEDGAKMAKSQTTAHAGTARGRVQASVTLGDGEDT